MSGPSQLPGRDPRFGEPPLIEKARRAGWALLGLALVAALIWRLGGEASWAAVIAVAAGLAGMLAIVNVALVRSLYRQLNEARPDASPPSEPGP